MIEEKKKKDYLMVWTISAELRKQVEITGRGLKTETISTGTSILTLALQH